MLSSGLPPVDGTLDGLAAGGFEASGAPGLEVFPIERSAVEFELREPEMGALDGALSGGGSPELGSLPEAGSEPRDVVPESASVLGSVGMVAEPAAVLDTRLAAEGRLEYAPGVLAAGSGLSAVPGRLGSVTGECSSAVRVGLEAGVKGLPWDVGETLSGPVDGSVPAPSVLLSGIERPAPVGGTGDAPGRDESVGGMPFEGVPAPARASCKSVC